MRDQSPARSRDADARTQDGPTDEPPSIYGGGLIGDWSVWLFCGGIFGWSWHHPRTEGSTNQERSVQYLLVSVERSPGDRSTETGIRSGGEICPSYSSGQIRRLPAE